MARLIDGEKLKNEVTSTFHGAIGLTVTGAVHEIIDRQPTIDPERLRIKAHWIYDGKTDEDGNLACRCSRCEHGDRHSPGITVPYCWFCGAKMEEKTDET